MINSDKLTYKEDFDRKNKMYSATLKIAWSGQLSLPEKFSDVVILEMTNLKSCHVLPKEKNE